MIAHKLLTSTSFFKLTQTKLNETKNPKLFAAHGRLVREKLNICNFFTFGSFSERRSTYILNNVDGGCGGAEPPTSLQTIALLREKMPFLKLCTCPFHFVPAPLARITQELQGKTLRGYKVPHPPSWIGLTDTDAR